MNDPKHVAPTHPPDAPTALQDVAELLQRLQELYQSLAERPDPGGETEQELLKLIGQRPVAAAALGEALVCWLAEGGAVELVPPPNSRRAAKLVAVADLPDLPEDEDADEQAEGHEVLVSAPPVAARDVEVAPEPVEPLSGPVEAPSDARPTPAAAEPVVVRATPVAALRSAHHSVIVREDLKGLLRSIGRPKRPRTLNQVHQAVASLDAVSRDLERWEAQPQDAQRALMGLASSLARHLQDELKRPLEADDAERLNAVFSRLSRWSREQRPGFVPGLSRQHSPDHGSWMDDVRFWWASLEELATLEAPGPEGGSTPAELLKELEAHLEGGPVTKAPLLSLVHKVVDGGVAQSDPALLALLAPHRGHLKGASGLKTLKTQLKAAASVDGQPDTEGGSDEVVPRDWPFQALTRGVEATIVGGDPRPHAADRIQEAFGFSSVRWEEADPRRVSSLAQRIASGNVGFVILLRRFISHEVHQALWPACEEGGVPVVLVDTGYGVTQVRLAIERDLVNRLEEGSDFAS